MKLNEIKKVVCSSKVFKTKGTFSYLNMVYSIKVMNFISKNKAESALKCEVIARGQFSYSFNSTWYLRCTLSVVYLKINVVLKS